MDCFSSVKVELKAIAIVGSENREWLEWVIICKIEWYITGQAPASADERASFFAAVEGMPVDKCEIKERLNEQPLCS